MIYGKANLMIGNIASQDKGVNVLSNVHLDKDGASCATDGTMLVAVTPLLKKIRKHSLIKDGMIKESFSLSVKAVNSLLKAFPRDLEFGGLLEMMSIIKRLGRDIFCKFTDGKNDTTIQAATSRFKYPKYKKVIKESVEGDKVKICLHRGRLLKLLETMDKASGGNSNDKPLFVEYDVNTKSILLRCKNEKTSQHILGIMPTYSKDVKWLRKNKWEKSL